jgi:hypothetical protein
MRARAFKCVSLVALVLAISISSISGAQVAAPEAKNPNYVSPSKWDIFLGYSYLAPRGTINGTTGLTPGTHYGQINWGGTLSVARYFNKNFGLQIEGDEHMQSEDWPIGDNNASFNSNDDFAGGSAGLIYRFPTTHFTPFAHVLVGAERVGSVYHDDVWGGVVTAGGGLDIETPLFNHHLAVRIFQTDYQFIHADSSNINAFLLSTGLVLHVGSIAPPVPITLACVASPSSIFPGDPVTVTAAAGGLNPKLNVIYSFSGTGVTSSGTTATVATASLASGSYSVQCAVKEGKPGREGMKPWESAESSASFTVKSYEPPTVSCTASPDTIKPGDTSTINTTGMSPQNRPLTYTYTASAGAITGSGNSAVFSSTGAPTGTIGVTCNVADDKGQTATASTSVTISAPPLPPLPHAQVMCSISFERDAKRPVRVDNEAKACLDQIAVQLQSQTDATAVIVGDSTGAEKAAARSRNSASPEDLAAQRAVNTKDYLVTEKGIDASRISVATASTDDQKVADYLVPSGANFAADVAGTTPVDESAVKAQPRKALGSVRRRHHRERKAAAEAAQPTQ